MLRLSIFILILVACFKERTAHLIEAPAIRWSQNLTESDVDNNYEYISPEARTCSLIPVERRIDCIRGTLNVNQRMLMRYFQK